LTDLQAYVSRHILTNLAQRLDYVFNPLSATDYFAHQSVVFHGDKNMNLKNILAKIG